MRKLIEYDHCLAGGGILRMTCIKRFDGGLLVLGIQYIPAVVPLAA